MGRYPHVYSTRCGTNVGRRPPKKGCRMARTIRDASLESRTARSRLKARGEPYYRAIEEGVHLGYRKARGRRGRPALAGKWVLRFWNKKKKVYVVRVIGTADDFSDADGVAILNFGQGQSLARQRMVAAAHDAAGARGSYTIADAMDEYIRHLESDGRSESAIKDARYRDQAFIRPILGKEEVATLA